MRVLLIFIDGLGIGEKNTEKNPCTYPELQIFNNFLNDTRSSKIPFGGIALALDTTLGVEGLPQSATGQTTLLTGVNAAKLLHRHLQGFPNERLREILKKESILKKVRERGRQAAFINAYRPIFFQYGPEALLRHLSVTSVANWAAGLPFFSLEDMVQEKAIYQDFTNQDLIEKGFTVPSFSPQKAGTILAQATREYDFCLYEYFKTDHAGHSQEMVRAISELKKLECFLQSVLEHLDLNSTLVIVTSDHGNIEDVSIKTHTRNPAMTLVWGVGKEKLAEKLHSIADVTPNLLRLIVE
ncbi:MAG: alkaline phosphatase [candidate division KSB1 bacterium]|nr:alkaline phosphatase [candidate division KSB1 bacterium]